MELKVYILIGICGSGKSTWSKNFVSDSQRGQNTVIINKDKIREMLFGRYIFKPSMEELVHDLSVKDALKALNYGINIIIDETNITKERREKWIDIVKKEMSCDIKIVYVYFTENQRNLENRMKDPRGTSSKKWEAVIESMKNRFEVPTEDELYDELITIEPYVEVYKKVIQNKKLPPALIVDLDGTISLLKSRDPFDASTCEEDDVNEPIQSIINRFPDYKIIFCSGREDKYREQTLRFLKNKCKFSWTDFALLMRKTGDFRKDSIIKEELFNERIKDNYYVEFVLDDRQQVCDKWRELGLTCLQVAPGDF